LIHSPKTEHHAGGESRIIPLFEELRPWLLEAHAAAPEGSTHVIQDANLRRREANLRTQMHRIIRRARLTPWPKPFQNLRSTRQTELEAFLPSHVVCAIMGNSEKIAQGHYLQVRPVDLDKAMQLSAEAAQKAAQQPSATVGTALHISTDQVAESAFPFGKCEIPQVA